MTQSEIDTILLWGCSHTFCELEEFPIGITKFQAFLAIKPLLHGKQYWDTLGKAYMVCDNLYLYRNDIKRAFNSTQPDRISLMNEDELRFLENMPDKITIYRGMTKDEQISKNFGVSWSLEKKVAEFFAYKYNRNFHTATTEKVVLELVINKSEVTAFLNSRDEFEIIYVQDSQSKLK